MSAAQSACVVAALIVSACSGAPRVGENSSPLVGEYECERTERSEKGEWLKWTYRLSLGEKGKCWLTPVLHDAINMPFVPMGRWEEHASMDGQQSVTVFRRADDPSSRFDLVVVATAGGLQLVSDDRELVFHRVR